MATSGEEYTNFARMGHLVIDICTNVFRAILDKYIPPATLKNTVAQNKKTMWPLINFQQKQLLYPMNGTFNKSSADMDMSLLYTLIRNLSGINPPILGWGKPPLGADTSLAANIDRIRLIRNEVYGHVTESKISSAVFKGLWAEVRGIVIDVETNELGTGSLFKDQTDRLELMSMDPEMEKLYRGELQRLHLIETDTKELLEKTREALEGEMSGIKDSIADVQQLLKTAGGTGPSQGNEASQLKDHLDVLSNNLADLLRRTGTLQGDVLGIRGQIQALELQTAKSTDLNQATKQEVVDEHTLTFLKSFEEDDKYFVETNAFHTAIKLLQTKHHVMLTGLPGDGKTCIAVHIMLKYLTSDSNSVRYLPYKVDSPEEWRKFVREEGRQLVLIDNIFGTFGIDTDKANKWVEFMDGMERVLRVRNGKTHVIITTRKHSLLSLKHRFEQKPSTLVSKENMVDLTSDEDCLNEMEREEILLNNLRRYDVHLGTKEIERIIKPKTYHGYPHCVKLFISDPTLRANGADFFQTPMKYIVKEIENFRETDKLRYCALVATLMFDGELNNKDLDDFKPKGDLMQAVIKVSGLSDNTPLSEVRQVTRSMEGSYMKAVGDDIFTFSHESIQDAVAYSFGTNYPTQVIQRASFKFILERIKTRTEIDVESDMSIVISKDQFIGLAKRFTLELTNGGVDCRTICKLHICTNTEFLNTWLAPKNFTTQVKEELKHLIRCTDQDFSRPLLYWALLFGNNEMCTHILRILQLLNDSVGLKEDNLSLILLALCYQDRSKEEIELILRMGADLNYRHLSSDMIAGTEGDCSVTPLLLAVQKNSYSNVKTLLENGALVNQRLLDSSIGITSPGQTALHIACKQGSSDIVKLLFQYGANPTHRDHEDNTAFDYACYGGHVDIVEIWFEQDLVDVADVCLHLITDRETVELLISKGADVNKIDRNGNTALEFVRTTEIAGCLLAHGALKKADSTMGPLEVIAENGNLTEELYNLFDKYGMTLGRTLFYYLNSFKPVGLDISFLRFLISNTPGFEQSQSRYIFDTVSSETILNKADVLQVLLENGGDLNIIDNEYKVHVLQLLVTSDQNVDILRLLLQNGANINLRNKTGQTPLMISAKSTSSREFIDALLEGGADVNMQDSKGRTALHHFVLSSPPGSYLSIINAKCDLSIKDFDGDTALDCCFYRSSDMSEVIGLILANSGSVDQDTYAKTLFHCVKFGNVQPETLRLIANVCDKSSAHTVQDSDGATPLHVALQYRKTEMVNLLLEKGASVNIADNDGNTPLHAYFNPPENEAGYAAYEYCCQNVTQKHAEKESEDIGTAVHLLSFMPEVNAENKSGKTPLILAASHDFTGQGDLEDIESLLKFGADVNAIDNYGNGAFHKVLWSSRPSSKMKIILEKMLSCGADFSIPNAYNRSMADVATVRSRTMPLLPFLFSNGSEFLSLLECEAFEKVILADLRYETKIEIIEAMVKKGCKINTRNWQNQTPLMMALKSVPSQELVLGLLKFGADVQIADCRAQNVLHHLFSTFSQLDDQKMLQVFNTLCSYIKPSAIKQYLMAKNADGRTPVGLCLAKCDELYRRELENSGSDNIATSERERGLIPRNVEVSSPKLPQPPPGRRLPPHPGTRRIPPRPATRHPPQRARPPPLSTEGCSGENSEVEKTKGILQQPKSDDTMDVSQKQLPRNTEVDVLKLPPLPPGRMPPQPRPQPPSPTTDSSRNTEVHYLRMHPLPRPQPPSSTADSSDENSEVEKIEDIPLQSSRKDDIQIKENDVNSAQELKKSESISSNDSNVINCSLEIQKQEERREKSNNTMVSQRLSLTALNGTLAVEDVSVQKFEKDIEIEESGDSACNSIDESDTPPPTPARPSTPPIPPRIPLPDAIPIKRTAVHDSNDKQEERKTVPARLQEQAPERTKSVKAERIIPWWQEIKDHCGTFCAFLGHGVHIEEESMTTALFRHCLESKNETNSTNLIKLMLQHKVDVNSKVEGISFLAKSIQDGKFNIARVLLENGADAKFVDNDGNSVLHHCITAVAEDEDIVDMIETLKSSGCDVNLANTNGDTPLEVAAGFGDVRLKSFQCLFECTERKDNVGEKSKGLALMLKCLSNESPQDRLIATLQYILENIKRAEEKDFYSALHMCVSNKMERCEAILEILKYGPLMVNVANTDGLTAVHLCIQSRKVDYETIRIIKICNEYGNQMNALTRTYCSALHLAAGCKTVADSNRVAVVELLLKEGCDPNAMDKCGRTPLHYVALSLADGVGMAEDSMTETFDVEEISILEEEDEMSEITEIRISAALAKINLLIKYGSKVEVEDHNGRKAADYLPSGKEYRRLYKLLDPLVHKDAIEPFDFVDFVDSGPSQSRPTCCRCVIM